MYSRLKLARNLLSINGIIFISIDDNDIIIDGKGNVVKYDITGPIWKKALRVVIVVGLVLAVKSGFKLLYKGAGIEVSLIMDSIRYFIMLFVSLGLCPLLFKKIKL